MPKRILAFALCLALFASMTPCVAKADTVENEPALSTEELQSQAEEIMAMIETMMASPLTRGTFAEVKEAYEGASTEVKAYYDLDLSNYYSQIADLIAKADKAVAQIDTLPTLTSIQDDDAYIDFAEAYDDAQIEVEGYESKFNTLKSREAYINCIVTSIKKTLVTNYSTYARAGYYYQVEEAYQSIGDFDLLTEEVRGKIDLLQEAFDKAIDADNEDGVGLTVFYNGQDIKSLLDSTARVVQLEEDLDSLPDEIESLEDKSALLRCYETYQAMTSKEQAMIPGSYVTKMEAAVELTTGASQVIETINDIGELVGEDDFENFTSRYETAYRSYQTFISKYQEIAGVADLITNANQLDRATEVLNMVKNIDKMLKLENAMATSAQIQMKSLKASYEEMAEEDQAQIYNYEEFSKRLEDVEVACTMRERITNVASGFAVEDEATIVQLVEDYNLLTDQVKEYVGDTKYKTLQYIVDQLAALNQNAADAVVKKIDTIGTVTIEDTRLVETLRTMYNKLTDTQKALVSNINTLQVAEAILNSMERDVAKANISDPGTFAYSGLAIKPSLTIKVGNETLVQDVDYSLTYTNNVKAGTGKITIQGMGNYEGTATKTFDIEARSLTAGLVTGLKTSYAYTGKKIKPGLSVSLGGSVLKKGTDYKVTYAKNKKRGKATVTIQGIGNYSGTLQENFKIKKRSVKKASVKGLAKTYARTGKYIYPKLTIKVSGRKLKRGRDYTITYTDNRFRGKARITITGKGNYKGRKKLKFKIV
ncbi:MAG: hypothetical protein K6G62_02430, partial [Eubacterium sp.]|nr:hypothetical protein [Eubacterium sp.]